MKLNKYNLLLLCIVIFVMVSSNTFSQYSSITIKGPETIKPGTTNLYECYANYNYGGTPTKINDPTWEIVDVNPEFFDYSAYLTWEFNSLKVTDFVIGEFDFTLKCTYQSLTATKRITVLPSPPKLIHAKNAYVIWVPSKIKDKSIFTDFAEAALSDAVFKGIIEIGLGISSQLVSKFGGFIFSIITSLPSVGPPTVFDLSLLKDGKEKNILNIKPGEDFIFQLKFSSGQNVTWQNGIQIEISRQRGTKQSFDPPSGFDFYSKLELLTPNESQSLRNMADYIMYPNDALTFNQPGVYRIKVLNEADSGTRVVYVQVSGESISDQNILLGFILDSSGSMKDNDPKDMRKSAMKVIVDQLQGNESVFIVDFDDKATWINPNNWQNINKQSLKNSINRINSAGNTDIGRGMEEMRRAIESSNISGRIGVLLLSDGLGKYNNQAEWFSQRNIPVYTISFIGKDNSKLLNDIAASTNGNYLKANSDDEIITAFNQFVNFLRGNAILTMYMNRISLGERLVSSFFTAPYLRYLFVTFVWRGSRIDLTLKAPDGKIYDRNSPDVEWNNGENYTYVKINNPVPGEWKAELYGADIPSGGEDFNLQISGDTPNKIDLVDKTVKGGQIELVLNTAKGSVKLSNVKPTIKVTTPRNNIKDISQNYNKGKITYLPIDGKGDYQFDVNILATDKSGNKIQRYYKRTVLIGNFVPLYINKVKRVVGNYIYSDLGTKIGNRQGLKCYIYKPGSSKEKKTAEGIVIFVLEDESTIEIQRFFGAPSIKIGDIIELDITRWQSDTK